MTLVELMVSMVVGLIVAGAAITVFLTTSHTYQTTESLGRVQENLRVAFELMARDMREATGNPCERSLPVYNVLKNPTAKWYTEFQAGVRGYEGSEAFADAAFGTSPKNRIAGTDAIELKSAASGVSIVSHTPPSAEFKVGTVNHGLAPGDLAIACDFGQVAVFQVTNAQPGVNATIVHNRGSGTPGNCTKGLGLTTPVNCDEANGTQYAYGCYQGKFSGSGCEADDDGVKNEPEDIWPAIIAKLRMTRWFIGANDRGGRSLYQASLRNDAGTLKVDVNEVVDGVQDMSLKYLLAGAASYVDATSVTAADWASAKVVAVNVDLTLEATEPTSIDGKKLQRHMQLVVTIRNHAQ
jgi:type IV pilus assembly protein PilW